MGNDGRDDALERFLLGEYWNDVVKDGDPAAPDALDPSLAETVRWLHAIHARADMDVDFDTGLKERLMRGIATFPANQNGAIGHSAATKPRGEATRPTLAPRPIRGPRALTRLAAAAMLVLTLGGLAVAYGGPRFERFTGTGTNHESIPAPLATAEATPGITSEPLFSVTLPDEAIPERGTFFVDLVVSTWPPGAQETAEPRPEQNGPVALFVMEGALTRRVDGPLRVFRAGGAVEDVAPGTDVVVMPGDLSLQFDHASGSLLRNSGSVPLRFISFGIIEMLDPSRFAMEGGAVGNWISLHPGAWIKEQSVAATVRRVTAAPGTTLAPVDEATATALFVEAGTLTWQMVDATTGATPVISPTYDAGRWVSWVKLSPDKRLIMRNDGDEPLAYLEMTIAPADEESGT